MASPSKSKHIQNIKGARSLNELLSVIDLIEGSISDLDKRTDKILSSLSNKANYITISISASVEKEISDFLPKGKTGTGTKGKKFKTAIDKNFKTPSSKDLVKNSVAIQELSDNITELEISLRVLQSKDFSKLDENSNATAHIKAVLKKAVALRDKQLKAMSGLSKNHTPKEHTQIVKLIRSTLIAELQEDSYSSIRAKTFILNPSAGIIYFQTFLVISDLANNEGYVYESYSYVLTSVFQTKDGELKHCLTTLKDPKTPGTFPIGKEVSDVASLKMKLRTLNHFDDLLFQRNKISMKKNTAQLRHALFDSDDEGKVSLDKSRISKHIKNLRVVGKDLYVSVDTAMNKTQKDALANKLFPVLRTIFLPRRSSKTIMAYKAVKSVKSNKSYLVFSLSRKEDTKTKEFVDKMSNLADVLNLNPKIKRSVLQKIVEEYEP